MSIEAEGGAGAGAIECQGLTKIYSDGTKALDALDLSIEPGHVLALLGPSGCGKTTLLRMIAGLESISRGHLLIDGRIVNQLRPRDRHVAMIFQNYALYPHMTVFENIAFGLRLRHTPKRIVRKSVSEVAELLGLTPLLEKRPAQLSGGQRQRVAMGRAIVREPTIFLMDEPLSNLDAQLRARMRGEIARLQRRLGVTTVYVTHDQTEAMVLGDRVAVLMGGVLQQYGTAEDVYDRPATVFVAQFLGAPSMSLLQATVATEATETVVRIGEWRLAFPSDASSRPRAFRGARQLLCGIRPEAFHEAHDDGTLAPRPSVRGVVELREQLGSEIHAHVRVPGFADSPSMGESALTDPGGLVVARLSAQSQPREGMPIDLTVDRKGVHFFDPETERRVELW